MKSRFMIALITTVLLLFFAVPLGIILYGAGAAISGLMLIGGLIGLQYPLFALFKSLGWIPVVERKCLDGSSQTSKA